MKVVPLNLPPNRSDSNGFFIPSHLQSYTVDSKGIDGNICTSEDLRTATGVQSVVALNSYGFGDLPNQPPYSHYKFITGNAFNIKRVILPERQVEVGKDGYLGKLNKDALEQQIEAGNRYITGSNIFSQFFMGV